MIENRMDDPAEWDASGAVKRTAAQVIIAEAQLGLPADIAAQYAGVSLRTYRGWISEGRAVAARIAAQPDLELTDKERKMAQFATDVAAAQAVWVHNANIVLESAIRGRHRKTVKTKKATALVNGQLVEYDAEVTTTIAEEPIELGPLMWRLSKLAPAAYGPAQRIELTGADGGPMVVDIGARVSELLGRIRGSIEVEGEESLEPAGPEQLQLEPGDPDGPVV